MATLPLFPELALLDARVERGEVVLTLQNNGSATIATRTYGQPEYRLIAKLFDGETQVQDRWLSLPCDLGPGSTATLPFPLRAKSGARLTLHHALQDVPIVDHEPFAEVRDVR